MLPSSTSLVLCIVLISGVHSDNGAFPTEEEMTAYLAGEYETQASIRCNKQRLADWLFGLDLYDTDEYQNLITAVTENGDFETNAWEKWFKNAPWTTYKDEKIRRQVKRLSKLGSAALPPTSLKKYNMLRAEMTAIFGSARICPYEEQQCNVETDGLLLEPDIEGIMMQSKNYDELAYIWNQWHEVTGGQIRNLFVDYVKIGNEMAILNGYKNKGEMWRDEYEMLNLENDIHKLWEQIKPFYLHLHDYVKEKLGKKYPKTPKGRYISAHILGDIYGMRWGNVYDLVEPFPNKKKVNITSNLLKQGYTVPRMLSVVNEFYRSLGLESMENAYGPLAITEQPASHNVVCHATAWDFCDSKDFRIKMCAEVQETDLAIMHHELGHIQYYMQYKDQPIAFRESPNPAFHEVIGDLIALSATTPQHYETIGLQTGYANTYEDSINYLLHTALNKIPVLPYALALDTWRWDVFSGVVPTNEWNQHYWKLRQEFQLVDAPNTRNEQNFDPGAKYHIVSDVQFINYFLSEVLLYQIHRALCIEAGQYDPMNPLKKPLHTCDIYRSLAVGDKLRTAMKVGASEHWSEVLRQLTGETELSALPLLEYYAPLVRFLDASKNIPSYVIPYADPTTEPVSQTVPIVVGAILGAVVLSVLIFYFVKQHKDKKKEELQKFIEERATVP